MFKKKRNIGKLLLGSFLIVAVLTACMEEKREMKIDMLSRPGTIDRNVSYQGNRLPLKPLHFIKLPVGTIEPEGWLKKYLLLQKEGLTGKLGEISAWLDKKDNAWLLSGGDHGWEEVPYWLKGYGDLAYILKDSAMIAETKVWIEAAIQSRQPDGFFGPVNERGGKRELWANMVMLWCLQSYYEYSGDKRVLTLMTDYFKWQLTVPDDKFLEDYWENSRGGDNLYSVYWLYNITGEQFLLELARKLHRNTADWTNESDLPNWHNVNIAQCFREPATYYMLSGDSADLQASYRVHHLVRRIFGQVPGGMFGADENARLAYIDPRQGTETCGFVEQMASDEIMLRMTGDPFWAEHCEEVAFNSYPAAVMPDFKALRYITCPNQVVSDSKDHKPGIDNGGPFLAMNPFSSRCCQHNHAQGWPYYIENLVYATPDNGLAAIIYGPCCAQAKVGVNGTEVILREETNYPFEEMIRFTVQVSGKVDFPLYLRVPAWCKGGTLIVNGETVAAGMESGKYVRLDRTWSNGDVVILQLPMSLSVQRWQTNQNSASVNYGPLTFSLLIEEEYRKVSSAENAIWDSKWQKGADEMIRFTVQVSGKVDFPLYLRVPAWCKGGTLIVNGETVAAGMESGKYVRLDRTWSNGDVVILQLPMSLSVQRWQTNQNSASVNYGPLTFSLLIEEEYRKVSSAENAIWDSKWQKGADVNAWPTYEIYPQSAWNYALKLDDKVLEQCLKVEKREWPSDNYPFTADNVPLVIKAQGRRVPSWGIDQYGLCGVLPEEGAPKSEILEDITLIPMGAARLRISAFPVTYE